MSEIFLSYRRNDSADVTGRIRYDLANSFSAARVFNDVYSVRKGQNFREAVFEAIDSCKAYLVVIGPRWLEKSAENGKSRLEDEDDNVRVELEAALAKDGLPIIPLLVGGAEMPSRDDLPESMKQLSFLNGMSIRAGTDYERDIEELVAAISDIGVPRAIPTQGGTGLLRWIGGIAAVTVVVGVISQLPMFGSDEPTTAIPNVIKPTTQPQVSTRIDIRSVQSLLNSLKFSAGAPDGELGPTTRRAVSAFQRTYGVPVSGEISSQLISQLNNAKANGFSNVMCDVQNEVQDECRNVTKTRTVPDVQTQEFELEGQIGCFYNINMFCNVYGCNWSAIETMCEENSTGRAQLTQQCQITHTGSLKNYDTFCECSSTYCGCDISGSCEKQIQTTKQEEYVERVCRPQTVTNEICNCRAPEVCPDSVE